MDRMKDQLGYLLEHGLFDSAHLLGCFLVSSSMTTGETNPYSKAESLVFLGDSLFGKKEFKRALSMYKQALQNFKIASRQNLIISKSSSSISNKPSTSLLTNQAINENEVKFKIALCHCELQDNKSALAELEGIACKARTLKMNLTLAKVYQICKQTRSAISCYKECLRHCPYLLEAIMALAELGVGAKDIICLLPQTPVRGGRAFDSSDSSRWLQCYVEAQCSIASNDYKGGLEIYSELLLRFPNNVHLLLEAAKVEVINGKNDEAIAHFEKVRSIDPFVVTYMDEYAMLLMSKSDRPKLNRLIGEMLETDPTRPECYVALSILWERKDEKCALAYAEKGIRINERHRPAHLMKGNLCSSLKLLDTAVAAFKCAQDLRADIRSFQGLVRSYVAVLKPKEALFAAREANRLMPQSSKAIKLVGDVHASNPVHRDKARKFYESALRLEPGYLGAALALADLHVVEGRNADALALLEKYLNNWPDDSLHVKIAQIHSSANMLLDSLSHYQAALRINPQSEAAKKGLMRLEKQMKGLDPDAPDEDDDNEVEDAEGDDDEAELLPQ